MNKEQYAREVADAQAINEWSARTFSKEGRLGMLGDQNRVLDAMRAGRQSDARVAMEGQRIGLEGARVGLEGARVGQEGQRIGILGAQQRMAEAKDDREAVRAGFDTRSAQRLEGLQNALLDTKATPEQRQMAASQIMQLSGKSPDEYQIVHAAGGQQLDANSTPYKVPDRIVLFNKKTGKAEEIAAPNGSSKLPPGMVRQVGTSGGKPVFEDKNGKRHIGE